MATATKWEPTESSRNELRRTLGRSKYNDDGIVYLLTTRTYNRWRAFRISQRVADDVAAWPGAGAGQVHRRRRVAGFVVAGRASISDGGSVGVGGLMATLNAQNERKRGDEREEEGSA